VQFRNYFLLTFFNFWKLYFYIMNYGLYNMKNIWITQNLTLFFIHKWYNLKSEKEGSLFLCVRAERNVWRCSKKVPVCGVYLRGQEMDWASLPLHMVWKFFFFQHSHKLRDFSTSHDFFFSAKYKKLYLHLK